MLSERSYWAIIITVLVILIVVSILWITPVARDVGVNLFTNAIFTIFTIVFLTVIIRSRENSKWKLIEKEVLNRIVRYLTEILYEIEFNFLLGSEIPKMGPEFSYRYVNVTAITLGGKWEELFQTPNEDAKKRILALISLLKTDRGYLEHVTSEYSRFLDPKFMHSIMEIQNGLDKLIASLQMLIMDLLYMRETVEPRLTDSIRTIIRELVEINQLIESKQISISSVESLISYFITHARNRYPRINQGHESNKRKPKKADKRSE